MIATRDAVSSIQAVHLLLACSRLIAADVWLGHVCSEGICVVSIDSVQGLHLLVYGSLRFPSQMHLSTFQRARASFQLTSVRSVHLVSLLPAQCSQQKAGRSPLVQSEGRSLCDRPGQRLFKLVFEIVCVKVQHSISIPATLKSHRCYVGVFPSPGIQEIFPRTSAERPIIHAYIRSSTLQRDRKQGPAVFRHLHMEGS